MRTYTAVTGVLFAVIVAIHVARIVLEGPHVLRDPYFAASTVIFTALAWWALRLFLGSRTRPTQDPGP